MPDLKPNRALVAAREAMGYSQRQLAARTRDAGLELGLAAPELEAICKQIYRLERGTIARPGDDFYIPAFCAALRRSPAELFGEALPATPVDRGRGWRVSSRKYVPIYLGCDDAALVMADPQLAEQVCEWMTAGAVELPYPDGTCTITAFPFGVLVAEIIEEPTFNSIAEFAVWRRASYRAARNRVASLISTQWPALGDRQPAYVLSTYRLLDQHWTGDDLHTAMRLLCVPGALVERHAGDPGDEVLARAELAERVAFRDGFTRPDIEAFGIDGVSLGYASWAGVSYMPLAPARAISADEMASFETVVQALWCYTNKISEVVETGADPVVPDEWGWRFVRACLSRLTAARPRESAQHRMMRDAILNTSRLTNQLADAHAILRETAQLAGRR